MDQASIPKRGRPPIHQVELAAVARERPDLKSHRGRLEVVHARYGEQSLSGEPWSWVRESQTVMAELGRLSPSAAVKVARQLSQMEPTPSAKVAAQIARRSRRAPRAVSDRADQVAGLLVRTLTSELHQRPIGRDELLEGLRRFTDRVSKWEEQPMGSPHEDS